MATPENPPSATVRTYYLSPTNLLLPLVTTSAVYVLQFLFLFFSYGMYVSCEVNCFSPYLLVDYLLYLAASYTCFMFARSALPFAVAQTAVMVLFVIGSMEKVKRLGESLRVTDLLLVPELFEVLDTRLKLLWGGASLGLIALSLGFVLWNFRRPNWLDAICLLPAGAALMVAQSLPVDAARRPVIRAAAEIPVDGRDRMSVDDLEMRGLFLNLWLESRRGLTYRSREDSMRINEAAGELLRSSGFLDQLSQEPQVAPPARPTRNVYLIVQESFWVPDRVITEAPRQGAFLSTDYEVLWKGGGGHFATMPVFGSGTANSEFEVLCGHPANLYTTGVVFMTLDSRAFNCLPRQLAKLGYHTLAMHPGIRNFYKRDLLYPALGFEKYLSHDDFVQDDAPGGFLADHSLYRQVQGHIEAARKTGKPFFAYILTIGGHFPYPFNTSGLPTKVALAGLEDERAPIHKELNLNWHASQELVHFLKKLREKDPDGIYVVLGDHLPDVALFQRTDQLNKPKSLGVPSKIEYYQTPLLFIDQRGVELPRDVLGYEMPGLVLRQLGVPVRDTAPLPLFRPSAALRVRPLKSSTAVLRDDGSAMFCGRPTQSEECAAAIRWRENAEVVSFDLLKGAQTSSALLAPAAQAAP